TAETAAAVAEVIHDDTGLPDATSHLLAVSLVGMGQIGARYWLDHASELSMDEAVQQVSSLAWRGLGAFPRTEEPTTRED
ncbi:MAG: TetR family transcriptional regulator, partial [Nocardioidaceae bacterium]|nr:TetR family transcriptional regulator [Nocardioidaceae bacterium]